MVFSFIIVQMLRACTTVCLPMPQKRKTGTLIVTFEIKKIKININKAP